MSIEEGNIGASYDIDKFTTCLLRFCTLIHTPSYYYKIHLFTQQYKLTHREKVKLSYHKSIPFYFPLKMYASIFKQFDKGVLICLYKTVSDLRLLCNLDSTFLHRFVSFCYHGCFRQQHKEIEILFRVLLLEMLFW